MNRKINQLFPVSWKDLGITLGVLAGASGLCLFLMMLSENDFHVPLIFLLSILLISFFTKGYLFGLTASFAAVFLVNYVFTYPYLQMNFSLTGYPLTFICMLATSVIGSMMATSFKESKELKMQAERESMRANLLRTVSHDFRTPLTSIIGIVDLIREQNDYLSKEEKYKLLQDVREEAEWLMNMVENLLSITRIGNDPKANIHKEPQAVEELVAEAANRFRKQYPELQVSLHVPEDILFVDADAMLIEQVISNILINTALHAKDACEIVICVNRQDGYAEFRIEDDGPGFSKEELLHAFDDYMIRSEDSRKKQTRGMGIGLSVCHTIIKAHNGDLKIMNRSPKGACVCFTLPLSEVNDHGTEMEDIDY